MPAQNIHHPAYDALFNPSEEHAALREMVEPWRPHRGAAAHLLWHSYANPPLG